MPRRAQYPQLPAKNQEHVLCVPSAFLSEFAITCISDNGTGTNFDAMHPAISHGSIWWKGYITKAYRAVATFSCLGETASRNMGGHAPESGLTAVMRAVRWTSWARARPDG
jgi:hypothetical protein